MARYLMMLVLLVVLASYSLGVLSALPITGEVTAKRGTSLRVEFSSVQNGGPAIGDRVEFSTILSGLKVSAGWGEVVELDSQSVWVKIVDGKPNLKMSALIQATGKALVTERPRTITRLQSISANKAIKQGDSGWGDVPASQPSLEVTYIDSIVAANQSCNYLQAEQLAEQARSEFPSNAWLEQNRETFEILARRSANYRQAMNNAYRALEHGGIGESIAFMKVAMSNASLDCGQDKQVLSLLEQAKQIAKIQREEVIEQARRNTHSSAEDSARHRAEIEQKRASDKAFGQVLQGNLLGLLKSINASETPAVSGARVIEETDVEMTQRMVGESEKNNSEILNKWRASQGWDSLHQPATTGVPETPAKGGDDSGW